jgi:hypothetical protein
MAHQHNAQEHRGCHTTLNRQSVKFKGWGFGRPNAVESNALQWAYIKTSNCGGTCLAVQLNAERTSQMQLDMSSPALS